MQTHKIQLATYSCVLNICLFLCFQISFMRRHLRLENFERTIYHFHWFYRPNWHNSLWHHFKIKASDEIWNSRPELQEFHWSISLLKRTPTALIKVIFKRKISNIFWLKLLQYRDLIFFVISGSRWRVFGVWTVHWTK